MNRAVTEQMLLFSDATFGNATTLRHGLLPKLAGGTTAFLRADGTWATPPGGGSGSGVNTKLYDYTVTGVDKASIDTFVDGTAVADFVGYDVLEVWMYLRTDEVVDLSAVTCTLNNDTGANYDRQESSGTDTILNTGSQLAQAGWNFFPPGASHAANFFSVTRLTIPNYLGTVGYKTAEATHSLLATAAPNDRGAMIALSYRSTSAVSRIKITPFTALRKIKVGSRVIVYGR